MSIETAEISDVEVEGTQEAPRVRRRDVSQRVAFTLLRGSAVVILLALGLILYFVFSNGLPGLSIEFLTESPQAGMTAGGVYPAIVGTLYLMGGSMSVALPLGILSAIYLTEYAEEGRLTRVIRLAINNLAGVPSVVFGLFGLAMFSIYFGFGLSLLSASLTLGLLALPVVIRASEEALMAVPQEVREASLALGVTKWQTVRHAVLPAAIPGIATGAILSIGRVAGETAPILFTGAAFFLPRLPSSPFDQFMALPYHLYVTSTSGLNIAQTRPLQYATALVLLGIVLGTNLIAIYIRRRYRSKIRW